MEASVEQSLQPEHLWSTVVVYNSVAPCSCNMHAPTGTGSRAGLTGLVDFTTHISHAFRQTDCRLFFSLRGFKSMAITAIARIIAAAAEQQQQ